MPTDRGMRGVLVPGTGAKDKLRPVRIRSAGRRQGLPEVPVVAGRRARANLGLMRVSVVTVLGVWLAACGGDDQPATPDGPPGVPDAPPGTPDADDRDLLVRLNDLPGVVAVEETDPSEPTIRLFDL